MRKRVHVAVGVIHGCDGRILIARRAAQQHLGGLWEFPGGKVEAGETVSQALARELHEELGIVAGRQSPLCRIQHDYSDKSVLLDVWHVHDFSGEAHGREGQPLRWVLPQELRAQDFPEANRAIIRALELSDFLAILPGDTLLSAQDAAGALTQLHERCPPGTLIRWRCDAAMPTAPEITKALTQRVALIVDMRTDSDRHWQHLPGIRGVHANRHVLQQLTARPVPDDLLFGASCHNHEELAKATQLGADYVLLSPVQRTLSHPDQPGMGWDSFKVLAAQANCAVYAMGGLSQQDLLTAQACGARGIAGIRLFNP